jgi:hypothetical protein
LPSSPICRLSSPRVSVYVGRCQSSALLAH